MSKMIRKQDQIDFAKSNKVGFREGKNEPITDGIINEKKYFEQKTKILWVMKEPWEEGGHGGWSIIEDFIERRNEYIHGQSAKMFNAIVRVSFGILKGSQNRRKIGIDSMAKKVFQSIAYINSSKMRGKKKTDMSELAKKFERWKPLILDQIDSYKPDIIIFAGTYKLYSELEGFSNSPQKRKHTKMNGKNKKLTFYYNKEKNRLYIDAYHPAAPSFDYVYRKTIVKGANDWLSGKL